MLKLQISCIGKIKEEYFTNAVKEYQKRLNGGVQLNILELPEYRLCGDDIQRTIEQEGKSILPKMDGAYNIAMCIEGQMCTSEQLSQKIFEIAGNGYSKINFIIGGSYGLSQQVKKSCQQALSFSKLTFPHQLFRVMLAEQLYRAVQIHTGSKYHK